MSKAVRVRFAPSPTGFLHIGGVRTALFNYLFARANNGEFILRLEDTDRERFVEEGVEQIIQSLDWLGLHPDEGVWYEEKPGRHGPYVQSERLHHYQDFADQLIKKGLAYRSYTTPEQLESLRQEAKRQKRPFVYRATMEPANGSGDAPIRIKVPDGITHWHDEVRGEFETNHELIDDFVIMKADGFPTYNFANVVDDHLMEISHVIRGDEFISSTAKHALLYDMLKFSRPTWVHLPSILGPDGKKKLSKRDGDVNVLDYKAKGYLPQALINYLALLGWNDGTTKEIFTKDDLISKFKLSRVQKSPAVFDINRLEWMNGEYIRNNLSDHQLIEALIPYVPQAWLENRKYLMQVLSLDRDRIKHFDEAKYMMEIFFDSPRVDMDLLTKKDDITTIKSWLSIVIKVLQETNYSHDEIEKVLRSTADDLEVQSSRLFYALRVSLTGRTEAPGLFDILVTLGKQESITRLANILK